jgi:hypothetical protein
MAAVPRSRDAGTCTKFSAKKPPSLSLSSPYFARFLFCINALIVPSGSSGMVPVLPRRATCWFVRQPYGASRCVDGRRESSLEVVLASGGAARPAEGSQVLRWAVLAVEPARPGEWFRGTEGRLDA